MHFLSRDDELLRVVLYRINRKKKYIHLTGPLLQKYRRTRADFECKAQLAKKTESSGWKIRPRAKLAIKLVFYSSQRQPPSLMKLAKYYLDLLQGLAYKDDRQIQYLTVQLWQGKVTDARDDSHVIISLQTLSDLNQALDIFHWHCEEEQERSFTDDGFGDRHEAETLEDLKEFLDPRSYTALKSMYLTQMQENLLKHNRIRSFDRPRVPGIRADHLLHVDLPPFSLDLGNLPEIGESRQWRLRLLKDLDKIRNRGQVFKRIEIPIELDVKVISNEDVDKDLDNLGLELIRSFASTFENIVDIVGYRSYCSVIPDYVGPPRVIMRLLPAGEINRHDRFVESALAELEESIDW